jgi:hypothetical protein
MPILCGQVTVPLWLVEIQWKTQGCVSPTVFTYVWLPSSARITWTGPTINRREVGVLVDYLQIVRYPCSTPGHLSHIKSDPLPSRLVQVRA